MHIRSRPSPAFRQGRNERAERNHELQRNPVTRRAHSTDAVPSRARSSGLAAVSATVTVDGRRWKQLGSLAELGQASPDSQVFALDDATGAVRFGDGVHGARPPAGATVRVRYRLGSGAGGNERISWEGRWPPRAPVVAMTRALAFLAQPRRRKRSDTF